MPNSAVTFSGGASTLDPVVPTLSKIYVYSDITDIVRLLSKTSGNTTVITNAEVLTIVLDETNAIFRENYKAIETYYLKNNTYAVSGSTDTRISSFASQTPYLHKFLSAMYVYTTRFPIIILDAQEFEFARRLTTTFANSVLGMVFDGFLSLMIGSAFTSPNSYYTDIYYSRQPATSGITTSNYTTSYVDLPDSLIPDLVDRSVQRLEMTKQ